MAQRLGGFGEGRRLGAGQDGLQGGGHQTPLGLDASQQHLLAFLIRLLEGQIEENGNGDEGRYEKNKGGGQRTTKPAHQCFHSPWSQ